MWERTGIPASSIFLLSHTYCQFLYIGCQSAPGWHYYPQLHSSGGEFDLFMLTDSQPLCTKPANVYDCFSCLEIGCMPIVMETMHLVQSIGKMVENIVSQGRIRPKQTLWRTLCYTLPMLIPVPTLLETFKPWNSNVQSTAKCCNLLVLVFYFENYAKLHHPLFFCWKQCYRSTLK